MPAVTPNGATIDELRSRVTLLNAALTRAINDLDPEMRREHIVRLREELLRVRNVLTDVAVVIPRAAEVPHRCCGSCSRTDGRCSYRNCGCHHPGEVAHARANGVCRICGLPAGGGITLNFGAEYAHTACLEVDKAGGRVVPPPTGDVPPCNRCGETEGVELSTFPDSGAWYCGACCEWFTPPVSVSTRYTLSQDVCAHCGAIISDHSGICAVRYGACPAPQ